jgi:glycosyltransferase involved in cell wall biosynthesis
LECYHKGKPEAGRWKREAGHVTIQMMRIAWFSPMPPVPSGIAAFSAEIVRALRAQHQIDVYRDEGPMASAPGTESAHKFVWRHRREPYDLTVYQVGNSSHHDYMWPYLFRYPGLTVLHDAHLHHARAASLLRLKRAGDYRAEFAASHPDADPDLAELAVAGFDNHLYYAWPMRRLVIGRSRLTAVHSGALAATLRAEFPNAELTSVRLAHGVLVSAGEAEQHRLRVRHLRGIAPEAMVFGLCGGLTPEKRIPQILSAFRAVLPYAPGAHLLLAGAPARHYDVTADVRSHGLERQTTITGYLESEAELTAHLAACDVSINLRWPTAREMSGPWLRALAAGRPTITTDLAHLADVPSLDPRTWRVRDAGYGIRDAGSDGARFGRSEAESRHRAPDPGSRIPHPVSEVPGSEAPLCVAIDILDEDHSLRLAMRRLAVDAELRASLGSAGQRHWAREHSMTRMIEDYERIISEASALPVPEIALPAHLVNDGDTLLNETLRQLSVGPVWE